MYKENAQKVQIMCKKDVQKSRTSVEKKFAENVKKAHTQNVQNVQNKKRASSPKEMCKT